MAKMVSDIRLAVLLAVSLFAATPATAQTAPQRTPQGTLLGTPQTTTPIKHVVVIFQENVTFDHYFATYPLAANPAGQPAFHALPGTPTVNGLTPALIADNPNSTHPFRLDRSQAMTCDNDNGYGAQQRAFNHGLMDKFPENTSAKAGGCTASLAMGYYDGNTVTALWNYAQRFAMSDNSFSTEIGTTVMGHLNLISGQTHQSGIASSGNNITNGSIVGNVEAAFDDCAKGTLVKMDGKNVGDLLNAKGITWGWFYAEFAPTGTAGGKAVCAKSYNNHYDPFQYYQSTANPHHLKPSAVDKIGQTDQANHQYDLAAFWDAVGHGNMPAVSFIKAPDPETGHPDKSDPLREQIFLVNTLNRLQRSAQWRDTAVIINWDDSDGWYDHVPPPIVNHSSDPALDVYCGTTAPGAFQDRCGYGIRLPLLVISPYAKSNFVDHAVTDQTSILRFIEDNWALGFIDGPQAPPPGQQSFDRLAGSLGGMFDFARKPNTAALFLDGNTGLMAPPHSH